MAAAAFQDGPNPLLEPPAPPGDPPAPNPFEGTPSVSPEPAALRSGADASSRQQPRKPEVRLERGTNTSAGAIDPLGTSTTVPASTLCAKTSARRAVPPSAVPL